MHVVSTPDALFSRNLPITLGAGFFDGVHTGHRIVLDTAIERARALGGQAWALTFDRHPLAVLAPSRRPPLLTTLEERLALLEATGVDGILLLPFTRELAVMEPDAFIAWLCAAMGTPTHPPAHQILCGENWRFGLLAQGTPELLRALGVRHGYSVRIVPFAYYQNEAVSSTRIRLAVLDGRMEDADQMLGRPWGFAGPVVRGRGLGRRFGFPTANLVCAREVVPPLGVYAVRATVDGRTFDGVANFGVHPTIDPSGTPLLEVHCFDCDENLYDRTVQIAFLARLREERRFAAHDDLVAQIRRDAAAARAVCGRP